MSFIHNIYNRSSHPVGKTTLGKLCIALMIFVAIIALFAFVAREVNEGETLRRDSSILLGINHFASPSLDRLMLTITSFGDVAAVVFLTAVLIAVFAYRKQWHAVAQIAFSMAGAGILNFVLKLMFARDRPHLWTLLAHETSYSFPSGHAMLTGSLALTCIFLAWHTKWRWPVIAIGAVYMIAIGFSRLYLGVHYPTDIIAGWIGAFAWVFAVATILGAVRIPLWYTKK